MTPADYDIALSWLDKLAKNAISVENEDLARAVEQCRFVLKEQRREIEEYDRSFELYNKAQRVLNEAYAKAHPEESDIHYHDAGKVAQWAAKEIATA